MNVEPGPVTFCARWHRAERHAQWFREHWYYTLGDSDLY